MKIDKFYMILISALTFFLTFIMVIVLFNLNVNLWFSMSALLYLFVLIYSIKNGIHAIHYYAIFFIYGILFPYLIQAGVGIRYLQHSGRVNDVDLYDFLNMLLNALGIFIGSLFFLNTRRSTLYKNIESNVFYDNYHGYTLRIMEVLLLCFVIIGGVSYYLGPNFLLSTRISRVLYGEVSSYIMFVVTIVKFIPYVALIYFIYVSKKTNYLSAKAMVISFVILSVCISNPINTQRFVSMTAMTMLIFAWLSYKGRARNIPSVLNLIPYVIVFILPLTSIMREGIGKLSIEKFIDMFSGLEFSSMQLMISSDKLTTIYDGRYLISALLIIVPRTLIHWKADSLGIALAEQSDFVFPNVGVPSFMAAYMDFGMFGVFVFGLITGYVLSWATIPERMNFRKRAHFYKLVIFSLVPIFARGDFSTFMIAFYAVAISYELIRPFTRIVWGGERMRSAA